jgi:NhaP-type Na+/H+ or K+/H+ antiporter
MTGAGLVAVGHAVMARSHELILLGGVLGLLSIIAGVISRRVGAPMLLVFLALGMVAGDDHLLAIPFDDFNSAYLIGSVALAVILFEGGLKTPVSMFRLAFWPAAVLATIGVTVTAIVLGAFLSVTYGVPFLGALLAGSAAAPTDAAAVAVLLRRAGTALPERLLALLEVESGLNDPMSVFLVFLVLRLIAEPGSMGISQAMLLFVEEMVGGAAIGLGGGWALTQLLKRLPLEGSLAPVLVLGGGLAVFGLAQLLGTSGFLATYLAAVVTGATPSRSRREIAHFFEGIAWLAQIVLFLMLGLLVTPEDLPPYLPGAVFGTAVLIFSCSPDRRLRLPAAVRVQMARDCLCLLGRAPRRGPDLSQHHSGISRYPPRSTPVRQHLHSGNRLAARARLDCRTSRPTAWLRASGMTGRTGSREGQFRPLSIVGRGSRCDAETDCRRRGQYAAAGRHLKSRFRSGARL